MDKPLPFSGRRFLRVTTVDALPPLPNPTNVAPEQCTLAYAMVVLRGNPDICYQLLRDASGDWDWRTVATG